MPGSGKKEASQTGSRKPETGSMVILGVDPGSAATGYGLIRSNERENVFLECGVIRTDSKRPLPEKLKEIFEGLSEIISDKNPDQLAIEETFYSKNAKSALVMGQARGVAILAAACAKLPVSEYSPKEVKSSVVGQGSASKLQVQYMVKNLLGLKELPQPMDAADALAIALCHAQKMRLKSILSTRETS
ncbi:MAG: crossover junction endodeoxyribonuclease RuvC [Candidatus Zixiibacteriota bacterium]